MLAHKIHKPVIKNFKRRNLYAWFKDNIWTADLAKMTSLSSKNGGVKYCIWSMFSQNMLGLIKPLKDKKANKSSSCFYWNSTQI